MLSHRAWVHRVHARREVVRLANALQRHHHLLRRRSEDFDVARADGGPILVERGVGDLLGSELDESLSIGPSIGPEDQVHAVKTLGRVVALEEGEDHLSRRIERQPAQPHDAIRTQIPHAHGAPRAVAARWRGRRHVGLVHLALARQEDLDISRAHVAVVERLHGALGRHIGQLDVLRGERNEVRETRVRAGESG